MLSTVSSLVLIAALAIAAASDLRTRTIPNRLTVPAFLVGLVLQGASGGSALLGGVAGAAMGLAIGSVLLAMGGMGGGDAKLLAVVGVFLGPLGFAWSLAYTGIAGGIFALYVIAQHRFRTPAPSGMGAAVIGSRRLTIPYGVPIAVGTALFLWLGALPW